MFIIYLYMIFLYLHVDIWFDINANAETNTSKMLKQHILKEQNIRARNAHMSISVKHKQLNELIHADLKWTQFE